MHFQLLACLTYTNSVNYTSHVSLLILYPRTLPEISEKFKWSGSAFRSRTGYDAVKQNIKIPLIYKKHSFLVCHTVTWVQFQLYSMSSFWPSGKRSSSFPECILCMTIWKRNGRPPAWTFACTCVWCNSHAFHWLKQIQWARLI